MGLYPENGASTASVEAARCRFDGFWIGSCYTMATSTDRIGPPESSVAEADGGPNFEQTLARLEEIVHLLEDGKIGLDDALGDTRRAWGCSARRMKCWNGRSGRSPCLPAWTRMGTRFSADGRCSQLFAGNNGRKTEATPGSPRRRTPVGRNKLAQFRQRLDPAVRCRNRQACSGLHLRGPRRRAANQSRAHAERGHE